MEKPFIQPIVHHKRRGNPNWGRPGGTIPAIVTEFERQVLKLGLTKEMCADSFELRIWCKRNRNLRYIPEWLLKKWKIVVNIDLNSAA